MLFMSLLEHTQAKNYVSVLNIRGKLPVNSTTGGAEATMTGNISS